MLRQVVVVVTLTALVGCAQIRAPFRAKPDADVGTPAAAGQTPGTTAAAPPATAVTVEQFDTTTSDERAAAAAAPPTPEERRLGTTIASIGNPSDPGFWAETGLVETLTEGRLEYPATGKSVAVELRPSGAEPGAGTRVSLPALRVLEAPLAGLPELVVFADGGT